MRYEQLPDGRVVPIQASPPPPSGPLQRRPMRGVGDVVARVAEPVARVLGIEHCNSCDQRQALLNSMFPFGRGRSGGR